jgi:hypothetical protein
MFCTITDIEQFLQTTIPPERVASVHRAITEATAAIRNYCHQTISRVLADTVTLDVPPCRWNLFLPELPVIGVSAVIEDGMALVAGVDYKLADHGVLWRVGRNWTAGVQIVSVMYAHGHDPIPDDVAAICTRAAARAYQAGLRAAESAAVPGVSAKSLGDYSVSFAGEGGSSGEGTLGASAAPVLLRSEKELLARYRYIPA